MITRRCFPHIPVRDVNSFSKKVTGQNQRPMSRDEGEFPVCWYTTKSTLSTEQVMWLEVLQVAFALWKTHPSSYSAYSGGLCNNKPILALSSIYSSSLVKQLHDQCSFSCLTHNYWQIDVMFYNLWITKFLIFLYTWLVCRYRLWY